MASTGPPKKSVKGLEVYATSDFQREIIKLADQGLTYVAIAERFDSTPNSVRNVLFRLRKKAEEAAVGFVTPPDSVVPPGHKLAGVSTMVKGPEGKIQWIKTVESKEYQEELLGQIREAFTSELPRERPVKLKLKNLREDLLNLYVLTDYHLGMKAWGEETRDVNWDMSKAEDLLVRWIISAVKLAPNAETAILGQLGDFLHWDGIDPVTPRHKYLLDVDTRYQKLVRISIRVIRRVVRYLLENHEHVHLLLAEGNHDIVSSMWLRETFSAWYDDEPRITVDTSPDPYYCYEFGKTSLFFHHGHLRKPVEIESKFAAKFRKIWGRTEFSYGHLGHRHTDELMEKFLMTVEQHQTLAPNDSHGSRNAWMSGRSAKAITYHRDFGEVYRVKLTPEMVDYGYK